MSFGMPMINDAFVSFYGSILSASFCGALNSKRNRWIFIGCMALIPLLQVWMYGIWSDEFLQRIYPLIVHLPLFIVLSALTGKILWSLISVLFAYLCCQLRRWIALMIVEMLPAGGGSQDLIELIITLPLLLFLLRFIAPVIRERCSSGGRQQLWFGVIPALYYCFDYFAVVYTDLLISGDPVVVEFMPFVCAVAYLVFLLYYSEEESKRNQLQQTKKYLDIQLTQSVREISLLRESQESTRQYRHDLRHHLQYVSACIENGQMRQAQKYISDICEEIASQKVKHYCENESANLILSAFAARAQKTGIEMNVQGSLPSLIIISDTDLCVILSNALENAIHACQSFVANGIPCVIDVQFYAQGEKLFLQIKNPCKEGIRFEKGVPVSNKTNHGIGVQSICSIVKRYGGIYSFLVRDGEFILRMLL